VRKGMIRKDVPRPYERTKLLNAPPKWSPDKACRNGKLDRQLQGCKDPAEWPVC